jgi:hypothetical protein
MLENQIIAWINGAHDFHAGVYLLKQVQPLDPIIYQNQTAERAQDLFLKLGQILMTGAAEDVPAVDVIIHTAEETIRPSETPTETAEAAEFTEPTISTAEGLSTAQRLSIEIGNIKKNRALYHNKLHDCSTDQQRKALILDIDKATDAIKYKNKLIKQLEAGEITAVPDDEKQDTAGFDVPADIDTIDLFELDNILRRYRSTRSKRAQKISRLEAAGQKDSPQYQQAVSDFKQLDQSIHQLDEHKQIRQKGTAAV